MNKPYNIQNTNICNGIFHISFFKALLINEGETTQGERESGQNDSGRPGIGAKRLAGGMECGSNFGHVVSMFIIVIKLIILITLACDKVMKFVFFYEK
jgi:hypothetical protein